MLAVEETTSAARPIASKAHSIRLVAIFLVLAAGGFLLHWRSHAPTPASVSHSWNPIPVYLSIIASEWLLFRAVRAGIGRTGITWRDLLGRNFLRSKGLLTDLAVAAAVVTAWITPAVLRSATAGHGAQAAPGLLPRGGIEIALWIAVAVTAGICEEFTFRGYFQRQFSALTARPWLGLGLQAALFGLVHSYQGLPNVAATAVYGAVLGGFAVWRGNLRAAMMAHTLTDIALGILLR